MVPEPLNLNRRPRLTEINPAGIPFGTSPSFYLFSANHQDPRSRFHWIAAHPTRWIFLYPTHIETESGILPVRHPSDIRHFLKSVWQVPPSHSPWLSGWFFLLGYELSWYLQETNLQPPALPDDHCLGVLMQPGTLLRSPSSNPDWTGHLAHSSIQVPADHPLPTNPGVLSGSTGLSYADYESAIRRILSHIRDGQTYEVNFCYPVHLTGLKESDQILFNRLVTTAGSSFTAYVNLGNRSILSGSPERFFSLSDNQITVQPMKGTRKRLSDPVLDRKLRQELKASEKDRAENLMIVDLMRNDLGRICRAGSVQTTGLFEIESYPTVHQMISTVSGTVEPSVTFYDILSALFPPGSMTGAPKRKTMELIHDLEAWPRGFYSGILGYWDGCSEAETSVLIRCMDRQGEKATIQVGGGIVADSKPEEEYGETLIKLKSTLNALGAGSDAIHGIGPGWVENLR
ncbi:MAG: anthranilate synthase component I family protein [Bacteroidetes bacterium]|nr:anthranilate synthase component I family protein [Bacteroidota bacterium]